MFLIDREVATLIVDAEAKAARLLDAARLRFVHRSAQAAIGHGSVSIHDEVEIGMLSAYIDFVTAVEQLHIKGQHIMATDLIRETMNKCMRIGNGQTEPEPRVQPQGATEPELRGMRQADRRIRDERMLKVLPDSPRATQQGAEA